MWNRYFTQTGSRIALLIGQVIVLLACVTYIEFVYTTNILPDKEAKESYNEASCFVISKRLNAQGQFAENYRADFLISYNVNRVQYNHWVSGNGLDMKFTQNRTGQEKILSRFDVGGTYPCWFNPKNPEVSILVLRHNWLSTFPLMIPSVISLIIIYYLMKNLFELISVASILLKNR
jgi:hypothetical protein